MKKIVGIIIAVVVAGVLVFLGVRLIKERKLEDLKEKTATLYPLNVKTAQIGEKNVTLTLPYVAEVKSNKDVLVNSKFAGKILYIAPLGKKVKKGEVVLKIDNTALKAKLKEVNSNISSLKSLINADEINLENLKATHLRTKELLKVKMASIEQFENEKGKIASLKAKIKSEKEKLNALYALRKSILNDLSYTDIKSSVDGIVSAKMLNKGDNVFPGKPALKISGFGDSYLFLALDGRVEGVLYKGKFLKTQNLNSTFNGLKTYKVNVNDKNLVPGQKVNVNVVVFKGKKTFVPFDAILRINNKDYIFIVDDKIEPREVHVIASGEEGAVIKENINATVIKASPDILLKIKAGYPVKVKG